MKRQLRSLCAIAACCLALAPAARADLVLDWNSTLRAVIKSDGGTPAQKANPGWSTRSMAMLNGAIFDAFQSKNNHFQPLLVDTTAASGTSLDAAINEASKLILLNTYAGQGAIINDDYNTRMAVIPDGLAKSQGIVLGQYIADQYIANRANDHSGDMVPYMPLPGPGNWRPDPFHSDQQAWGPGWGMVTPFMIPNTTDFINALPPIPALDSQAYTDAFNLTKDYGALNSVVRSADQTAIGLFWAYDHPGIGPPPVLYNLNLADIAVQAGNTPEENARLFALSSVSMADAAIAAWDAKFKYNFWRPVTAIQEADTDGNPNTNAPPGDPWRPLGAPDLDPLSTDGDFTPPFPAWTSGHATMGGALFESLKLFYGTNEFDAIDGILGDDPLYTLTSAEPGGGFARQYATFTQTAPLAVGAEDSPEGENGTSRVYLGIHWMFDQVDGISLGHAIAGNVYDNCMTPVPEPSTWALAISGAVVLLWKARRTRQPGRRGVC